MERECNGKRTWTEEDINHSEHAMISVEGQRAMVAIMNALENGDITIEQLRAETARIKGEGEE